MPIVFAQDWVFNSEYLELNLDIGGKIKLVPTSSKYKIEYIVANLSFFPQESFQEDVLDITTEPVADTEGGLAIFKWNKPDKNELDFNVNSNIKSFNKVLEVKRKVKFPLSNLPDDVKIYTIPSETIDSDDDEIIRKASEIIEGESDLFIIEFKLADWTKNNVKYNLSTLTESVSQKASWVLRNKEGVCDELTNLFIAMNRALGIPAKFISGVAYTNALEFGEVFGPHGWAEVYFPGYGWVPFDVTYGEFGFVDAGHIKLKESLDATDASTRFQWLGQNIDVKTSPLDIKVILKDKKGVISNTISITARSVKDNLGFGSYNLIEAAVKNLKDYYVATELSLIKSKEVEVIGDTKKSLYLKPAEEKRINWIVRVSDNLEGGYVYTFPFMISSLTNTSSEARFDVKEEGKIFSLEGIEELLSESKEEKSYSGDLELNCKSEKEGIYEYESTIVECNIKNIGNVYLEDLNICLAQNCRKIDLGINREEGVSFNFEPKDVGMQEVLVKASNAEVSESAFFDVTVYDQPSIEITELAYPESVEYKDGYDVSFILDKKSKFAPYNISIRIEPVNKEWEINQLNENRRFVLKMYGSELNVGENNFKVFIEYEDKNGKNYETSKEFIINLVNVNALQRVIIFFKNIERKIIGVFK